MNHLQSSDLEFIKFNRTHYDAYASWFKNEQLNRALGPIDEEWLNHVLISNDGHEWAIIFEDNLIAVLGVVLPTSTHAFYVISNIAIDPSKQRRGLGTLILSKLIHEIYTNTSSKWRCYVEKNNSNALHFFLKNNWKIIEKEGDMWSLELSLT